MKEKPFHRVYLGLGSNIKPVENLRRAIDLLCEHTELEALSSVWETPPDGLKGPNFLNAAAALKTQLSASLLKSLILRPIEIRMGRVRTVNKYAPRTIDLDILIFDGRLVEPKIWTQAFLAVPLSELIPEYPHPTTGETISQAAARLADITPLKQRMDVLDIGSGSR